MSVATKKISQIGGLCLFRIMWEIGAFSGRDGSSWSVFMSFSHTLPSSLVFHGERENEFWGMAFTTQLRVEYASTWGWILVTNSALWWVCLSGGQRERIKAPSWSLEMSGQPPAPHSNTSEFALAALNIVTLCDLNNIKSQKENKLII